MLRNITAPYHPFESWIYDYAIAPTVADMARRVPDRPISNLPQGGSLLDVGCGGGQILIELARERPDIRATGLDLSSDQVRRARRRAVGLGERVRFVEGSAIELPFDNGAFDGVMSVGSIKHWPDPAKGLAECVRVLKPGGFLMIVEADRSCRLEDARSFVNSWRLPGLMRRNALMFFRTFVAGQAPDLSEARSWMEKLGLAEFRVERIPSTPGLMMTGRK